MWSLKQIKLYILQPRFKCGAKLTWIKLGVCVHMPVLRKLCRFHIKEFSLNWLWHGFKKRTDILKLTLMNVHNIIDKNNFSHIGLHKDLYSRKDMNLARFSIDCMQVCCMARTSEITHSAIRWRCVCLD